MNRIQNIQHMFSTSTMNLHHILQLVLKKEEAGSFEEFQTLINDPKVDRMLGSMFGAFIGDSLGSYCEFTTKEEATEMEFEAMKMPGGGPFNLQPGQITDDSEMAIHLLTALLNYQTEKSLESQIPNLILDIAHEYVKWKNSMPFDIGITCKKGLSKIEESIKDKTGKVEEKYEKLKIGFKNVERINGGSLSNGFLMRITPLAILHSLLAQKGNFTEKEGKRMFARLIEEENRMTHSIPTCFEASTDYIELISSLIRRPSFSEIHKISNHYETLAKQNKDPKSSKNFMLSGFEDYQKGKDYFMCATVNEGFFKIAYSYCFKILKQISSNCKSEKDLSSDLFKNVMAKVITQGGDTDTNACIAGGLVGSMVGFKKLPSEYLEKQLGLRLGVKLSVRKEIEQFYEPRNGLIKLIKLIKKFK